MRKTLSLLAGLGLLLVIFLRVPTVQAQVGQEAWTQPLNLSRSGAASQPRLLAGPDGTLQAFWIDQFDGLMTASYNGAAWSVPAQTQAVVTGFGQGPENITEMPYLIVDPSGFLYAFHYGEKDRETGETPLIYSRMPIGATTWPAFQEVAESAQVIDVDIDDDNELKLAYLRPLKTSSTFATQETEPGVYLRSTFSGGTAWRAAVKVHESIYYRLSTVEFASLSMADSGEIVSLVWNEPRLGTWLASESLDNGDTWAEPQSLDVYGGQPENPWLAALPEGGMLRIWQDASQSGCILYQQQLITSSVEPSATGTPSAENTPTATPSPPSAQWSQPEQILEGLDSCPTDGRFFISSQTLNWVWGEGSSVLYLSAWDSAGNRWSSPQALSFSFNDAETGRDILLGDLHAYLLDDTLSVIGSDEALGEVWFTQAQSSALEIVYSPPPLWSTPQQLSPEGGQSLDPTVAVDISGAAHIVWSQGEGEASTSLYYARFDGQENTTAIQIVRSVDGEIARQPNLAADSQDRLHLVWSGGEEGQVYYTRALSSQAGSASGWLPAKRIGEQSSASRPQIVLSPEGRLVVAYSVPFNENRGIYVTASSDGGDTWEPPELVFDAVAAGWQGIDHLALLATENGVLHASFTRLNLASTLATEGIYYSRSTSPLIPGLALGGGWTEPYEVAPAGSDWPSLARVGGQLHLLYTSPSGLEQRWALLEEMTPDGLGWGGEGRVPGWGDLLPDDQPPYALTSDASTLHLVSAPPGATSLRYSSWSTSAEDPSSGRWSQLETYAPAGRWTNVGDSAASSQLSGGNLGIAWLALENGTAEGPSIPGIYFSRRSIGEVAAPPPPAPLPTTAGTPMPTIESTLTPTATLVFEREAAPSQEGLSPLILGGGLAAIVIVALFAGILMRKR